MFIVADLVSLKSAGLIFCVRHLLEMFKSYGKNTYLPRL